MKVRHLEIEIAVCPDPALVLTWISIYWFSCAGPAASLRIYFEVMGGTLQPKFEWPRSPTIPMGISSFPKCDHSGMPPGCRGIQEGPVGPKFHHHFPTHGPHLTFASCHIRICKGLDHALEIQEILSVIFSHRPLQVSLPIYSLWPEHVAHSKNQYLMYSGASCST